MAAIAKTVATTSTVLSGARSWADVARGTTPSVRDDEHDDAMDRKKLEHVESKRPWRSASVSWPASCEKPLGSETTRPWKSIAQRMSSTFAECADDEELEAVRPDHWEENGSQNVASSEHPVLMQPAARGSKKCFCHGEVLIMLGNYGWLAPHDKIDHPAATKNGGRIYVHRRDVADRVALVEGDQVSFYLYVDDQGLGAEDCRLESWFVQEETKRVLTKDSPAMNPCAATFVPCMNPNAATFVPSTLQSTFCPPASTFVAPKLNFLAVNEAYWSDDSDEESESAESDGGSDGDDEIGSELPKGRLAARVSMRRGIFTNLSSRSTRKTKTKSSSRGSASTGVSSDSEGLSQCGPPPGLVHPTIQPPPGLSLP